MKVIICSDSHGYNSDLKKVLEMHKPDIFIHAGDIENSEKEIREAAGCICYMVKGNNDFFSDLPREEFFEIAGFKILLTHGHTYGISMGTNLIKVEAKDRGADIVICGHTHMPMVDRSDEDVILLNPGSISFPRQEGRRPSYMIFEIDKEGQPHFTIAYL